MIIKVERIKNFINPSRHFVDHSQDVSKGDTFISINGGCSYLSKKQSDDLNYVLILDSTEKIETKYIDISDQKNNYLSQIEEVYGYRETDFNKFFVTGTNGKTTTIHFLSQMLNFSGSLNASSGTLGIFINNKFQKAQRLTTETPIFIRNFLQDCTKNKIKNILFEASSIGLEERRLAGLTIDHAALSNISRDHLDYHGTFANYLSSKLQLASLCKGTFSYVKEDNISDLIKKHFRGDRLFSLAINNSSADINIQVKKVYEDGIIDFFAETPWGSSRNSVKLFADYNLLNIFLGLPFFMTCSESIHLFFEKIPKLILPTGRLQLFEKNNKKVFIDFAHTPEAIEKTLASIKKMKPKRIILVFGAGGERDQGKRAQMGEVAEKYADQSIITSDNPRNENPNKISEMITKTMSRNYNYEVENDRKEAIVKAFACLNDDEILLIAGKGHENYQIIEGSNQKYSDIEEVKRCLKLLD